MQSRATELAAQAKRDAERADLLLEIEAASKALQQAKEKRIRLVREENKMGVPIMHLAQAAGLSRPTIHEMIRSK